MWPDRMLLHTVWFLQALQLRGGGLNRQQKGTGSKKDRDEEGQEANTAVLRDIARRCAEFWSVSRS
jgi:hypothetical protein